MHRDWIIAQIRAFEPMYNFLPRLFPQIAIAIGVLTSNRGEGDEPLWRIGRGTRVPLQGAVDVVPLLGAIVGCHCSVLWLRGRVTTNFGGADVVPLLGAIARCHCSVLWWGEGVFLLEVQYSILKSLISTCVLSYVGSREDWLLDRICES